MLPNLFADLPGTEQGQVASPKACQSGQLAEDFPIVMRLSLNNT